MKIRKKSIIILFELLMLNCLINMRNILSKISNNNKNSKINNFIKENLTHKINILKNNKNDTNTNYFNTLYIIRKMRFGNYFISLNNAIIFCELLCCKRIIIDNDFIKK